MTCLADLVGFGKPRIAGASYHPMVFKHGVSTNAVKLPLPLGEGRGEGDVDARTSCFRIILTMLNLKVFRFWPYPHPTLSQREREQEGCLSLWEREYRTHFLYEFSIIYASNEFLFFSLKSIICDFGTFRAISSKQ
jgi:hypothetical protein